jgi:hypothetical protein
MMRLCIMPWAVEHDAVCTLVEYLHTGSADLTVMRRCWDSHLKCYCAGCWRLYTLSMRLMDEDESANISRWAWKASIHFRKHPTDDTLSTSCPLP